MTPTEPERLTSYLQWEIQDLNTGQVIQAAEWRPESTDVQTSHKENVTVRSIPLGAGFHLAVAGVPHSKVDGLPGFALTASNDEFPVFCWEWFQIESRTRAKKIQEQGVLRFALSETADGWEVGFTELLTDVSLRLLTASDGQADADSEEQADGAMRIRWRIRIAAGSRIHWIPPDPDFRIEDDDEPLPLIDESPNVADWLTGGMRAEKESRECRQSATLEQTLAEIQSPDADKRFGAAMRLRELGGPEAVAALISAMEDPEVRVRSSAALALGGLEAPEGVDSLLEHLANDPSSHVRAMCCSFLGYFIDARVTEALIAALGDEDWKVVNSACANLQRLKVEAATPRYFELLGHLHPHVREIACSALVELGIGDPRIVMTLEQLVDDPVIVESERFAEVFNPLFSEHIGEPIEPIPGIRDLLQRARALTRAESE